MHHEALEISGTSCPARYINDRKLPDKAIDVIDEAGAAQRIVRENERKAAVSKSRELLENAKSDLETDLSRTAFEPASEEERRESIELDATATQTAAGQEPISISRRRKDDEPARFDEPPRVNGKASSRDQSPAMQEDGPRKVIGAAEIEAVVAKIARIPPKTVSTDDAETLKKLEDQLKLVVFGQDDAIEALSSAIKLARAGLREPEKPIGSYLFAGPTGVGKTEVAKQLAEVLGVEMLRFDMSEYMEKHSVSRLIGAPPGYVGFDQGGLLTDGVDQHPHCVLLLDEMEKAHPDVYNILLQVMDHGKLTDHNGRTVDFRNVILIMTSNAGAAEQAANAIGFGRDRRVGEDEAAIERTFSPEFRNRLDAVISFSPLPREVILKVVEKFLVQLDAQLQERGVSIEPYSEDVLAWLADRGYDEKMGARPMARIIQEHVKKPLADTLLFGDLKNGGAVWLLVRDGELIIETKSPDQARLTKEEVPLLEKK